MEKVEARTKGLSLFSHLSFPILRWPPYTAFGCLCRRTYDSCRCFVVSWSQVNAADILGWVRCLYHSLIFRKEQKQPTKENPQTNKPTKPKTKTKTTNQKPKDPHPKKKAKQNKTNKPENTKTIHHFMRYSSCTARVVSFPLQEKYPNYC